MANDHFVEILKDLEAKKTEAQLVFNELIENLDTMIEKAQNIIKSNGIMAHPALLNATQRPIKKVKVEEIIEILRRANKAIHIDEICKIIGEQKGSNISRIKISMVISHYIRRLKKKAEIKKLGEFSYSMKK